MEKLSILKKIKALQSKFNIFRERNKVQISVSEVR